MPTLHNANSQRCLDFVFTDALGLDRGLLSVVYLPGTPNETENNSLTGNAVCSAGILRNKGAPNHVEMLLAGTFQFLVLHGRDFLCFFFVNYYK